MTEEVKKEDGKQAEKEQAVKTEEKAKEPEYTPTQRKAMDEGWRPKEQFEGPEEEFIDAAEFLRRGELFNKIEHQRKEMAELRKTLRVMQEHTGKVREAEFNRAIEILKKQKVDALKENEPERVVEIETQIDEVRDQLAVTKANAQREQLKEPAAVDPRFSAWVDKNKWYAQNTELKEFADSIGIAYTKSHPGIDPVEVLKYVEKRVKTAYPENFSNPNRERASKVEAGDGTRTNTSKKSSTEDYELTAEEEKVFATLKRSDPKLWTREKYVADLKLISDKR